MADLYNSDDAEAERGDPPYERELRQDQHQSQKRRSHDQHRSLNWSRREFRHSEKKKLSKGKSIPNAYY